VFGVNLDTYGKTQAFYEVKTRSQNAPTPLHSGGRPRSLSEPLSIYLTVRRYQPIDKIEEMENVFNELKHHANVITMQNVIPGLLNPIARTISSHSQGFNNHPGQGFDEDNTDHTDF